MSNKLKECDQKGLAFFVVVGVLGVGKTYSPLGTTLIIQLIETCLT